MKREKPLWRSSFTAAVFSLALAAAMFAQSGAAHAKVCLVPVLDGQSKCATEATPCTTLAEEDLFNYFSYRTDGDDSKITIDHHQSNISNPSPITLDLCYESENNEQVGGYNISFTPTDMITDDMDCQFQCDTWATNAFACDGWHEMNRYSGTLGLGMVCSAGEISYALIAESAAAGEPPVSYTTGNVILARFTFSGVNKTPANHVNVSPSYGVTDANIAKPIIGGDTEVVDFQNLNTITGDIMQTEIEVSYISEEFTPPPTAAANRYSCAPDGGSLCPLVNGETTDGVVTLNWTRPQNPYGFAISNFTYQVYRNAAVDYPESEAVTGCQNITATSCTFTESGVISEPEKPVSYFIYARTSELGQSFGYLQYDVVCSCDPALSLKEGWNLVALSTIPNETSLTSVFTQEGLQTIGFHEGELKLNNDSIKPPYYGNAYWVHAGAALREITVAGTEYTLDNYYIYLYPGWNAIGSPYSEPVPWDNAHISCEEGDLPALPLSQAADLIRTTIYKFDPTQKKYTPIAANSGEKLEPWEGYLIRARRGCSLIIEKP